MTCLTRASRACYVPCVVVIKSVHHKLVVLGHWQRVAAVFLLALAFVDITVIDAISPQLCTDGAAPLPSLVFENAGRDTGIGKQPSQPDEDSHSDSTPDSTGEECFCCCAHIIPSQAFDAGTMMMNLRIDIPFLALLPSPPPQDTFHPPRLA